MLKLQNKFSFSDSKITKIFFSSLLIGFPVLTALEAKADMHAESMPKTEMGTENDAVESEEDGLYNQSDGGYDGEPTVTVAPTEGTINVLVKNQTNAAIDYQARGYTENQTLEGGEQHILRNLPVPVVIRAARQDDGFIQTMPEVNQEGMLELTLDEASERNIGVVRIEEDGSVYIDPSNSG
ncbi:hypothetical protein [Myxosarcina sp. GI1]|uniref:hypothetical protein n=1 Tax=Myxosarcina sp. GI1 TaxID=1541065 RepID=UPI0006893BA7|nr:hypothetical protein [Myxosarcina sp. GI1]